MGATMNQISRYYLLVLVIALLPGWQSSFAADDRVTESHGNLSPPTPLSAQVLMCEEKSFEIAGKESIGSAGFFSNWRRSDSSVTVVSENLFRQAFDTYYLTPQPKDFCADRCVLPAHPDIIFRSIPRKYLSDYGDKDQCNRLYLNTKRFPLRYSVSLPREPEKLNEWIADFSQGENDQGKALYIDCPGSCSPQYEYVITPVMDAYAVNAQVVCGPARDKGDDMYTLSYSFRWQCREPKPDEEREFE